MARRSRIENVPIRGYPVCLAGVVVLPGGSPVWNVRARVARNLLLNSSSMPLNDQTVGSNELEGRWHGFVEQPHLASGAFDRLDLLDGYLKVQTRLASVFLTAVRAGEPLFSLRYPLWDREVVPVPSLKKAVGWLRPQACPP